MRMRKRYLLYKLECVIGISTMEENRTTTRKKYYDNLSGVFGKSAADTWLALFSAMNEWQRVLFFIGELLSPSAFSC